jgi:hydrogenase maturation protein HypF
VEHMQGLLRIGDPDIIACDMHPQFLSRQVADELVDRYGSKLVQVQHHHAHLASLMAESNVPAGESMVTIDCDGYGYGLGGGAWGGEILLGGYESFKRVGHLEEQPMPGGDLAAYRYGRMLQGVLYSELPQRKLQDILTTYYIAGYSQGEKEIDLVFSQIERGFNTPLTTSAGRLLDAVSCLLGISYKRTYEGEGAMKLESAAYYHGTKGIDIESEIVQKDGLQVLQTSRMVAQLMEKKTAGNVGMLAFSFQRALAKGLAEMAITSAQSEGVKRVGFTGGVAFNEMMTQIIREKVESEGLVFLRHTQVPPGDGGLSLGQAAAAVYSSS